MARTPRSATAECQQSKILFPWILAAASWTGCKCVRRSFHSHAYEITRITAMLGRSAVRAWNRIWSRCRHQMFGGRRCAGRGGRLTGASSPDVCSQVTGKRANSCARVVQSQDADQRTGADCCATQISSVVRPAPSSSARERDRRVSPCGAAETTSGWRDGAPCRAACAKVVTTSPHTQQKKTVYERGLCLLSVAPARPARSHAHPCPWPAPPCGHGQARARSSSPRRAGMPARALGCSAGGRAPPAHRACSTGQAPRSSVLA
jgi:hypothetical protein